MQVALCNGVVGPGTQMFSSCGYHLYPLMVVVLMMQQLLKGFLKLWWYAWWLDLDSCLLIFFQCYFDIHISFWSFLYVVSFYLLFSLSTKWVLDSLLTMSWIYLFWSKYSYAIDGMWSTFGIYRIRSGSQWVLWYLEISPCLIIGNAYYISIVIVEYMTNKF